MAIRLDKLMDAWRSDQRPRATVEFCGVLVRASNKPANASLVTPKFLKEFGEEAMQRHPQDVEVMLGVAGLYVTAGLLDMAEALLAQAGQLAPTDSRLKKLMGKVRLHQGIKGGGSMRVMSEMPKGISFVGTGAPGEPPPGQPALPNLAAPGVPRSLSPAFGVAASPVAPMPRPDDVPAGSAMPPPAAYAPPVAPPAAYAAPAAPPAAYAPPVAAPIAPASPANRTPAIGAGPIPTDAPPLPVRPSQEPTPAPPSSPEAFGVIQVLPESSRSGIQSPATPPPQPMDEPSADEPATMMMEVPAQVAREAAGGIPPHLAATGAADADAAAGTEIYSYDDAYLEKLKAAGEQGERADAMSASALMSDEELPTQVADLEQRIQDAHAAQELIDEEDEGQATQIRDLAPMSTSQVPRPAAGQATGGTMRMVHDNPLKAFPAPPTGSARPPFPDPPTDSEDDGDQRTAIRTEQLAAVHFQRPAPAAGRPPEENAAAGPGDRATKPFDHYPGSAAPMGGSARGEMPTAALSPDMMSPEIAAAGGPKGLAAPRSGPVGAPPLPVVPAAAVAPRPARRSPLKVFLAVTAVTSALGIGVVLYFEMRGPAPDIAVGAKTKSGVPELDAAILRGGRADLDLAKATLDEKGKSKTAPMILAGARERALRVLDHDPTASGLEDSLSQAKALGLPAEAMAFAELTASAQRDGNGAAKALIEKLDELPNVKEDPFYQLASGVVLERGGDEAALERYQMALGQEPGLMAAEFRLVRAMLLYGDVAEGRRRAGALDGDRPEAVALQMLAALVQRGGKAPSKPTSLGEGPPLPLPLATIVPLAAAVESKDRTERKKLLKQVIEGADIPSLIVLAGSTALEGKDAITAQNAATAALEMAADFPEALRLMGRIVMRTGQLDRLEEVAMGATGSAGAALEGVVAYERDDFARLLELHQMQSGVAGVDGLAVNARYQRMLGSEPLSPETLSLLRQPSVVGGQIVVADAALDAGDLEAARAAMETFADPATHPLVARRWGRLLRYELDMPKATVALESAAPTRIARMEQILVEAESKEGRRHALAVIDPTLEPERPFLEAYIRARDGDDAGALEVIADATTPGGEAALSLRIAAALALGEIGDMKRGERLVRALLATYPKNPDVVRAAVGLGLLPRSAMRRE